MTSKKMTIEDLAIMVAKGFEETAGKIDGVQSDLNSFKSEVNERFEKVDERFEKVEDILERMDREMVKKYDLDHMLSGFDNRITRVEEHLNIK